MESESERERERGGLRREEKSSMKVRAVPASRLAVPLCDCRTCPSICLSVCLCLHVPIAIPITIPIPIYPLSVSDCLRAVRVRSPRGHHPAARGAHADRSVPAAPVAAAPVGGRHRADPH